MQRYPLISVSFLRPFFLQPLYSSAVQKTSATSLPTQSLSKLKELLDELVNLDAETRIDSSLLIGNVYLMKFESIKGLVWKGMISKIAVKDELLNLKRLIEKIDVHLFKKVSQISSNCMSFTYSCINSTILRITA